MKTATSYIKKKYDCYKDYSEKSIRDVCHIWCEVIEEAQNDVKKDYEAKVNELLSALEQIANAPQPFNAFDKGYEQGYNDATREACQEIAKNYQPNDR